jgi:acyl-CoA thioesterase FadM
VAQLGRSAITTEIDVIRGEELLVAGRLRHVCVSTLSGDGSKPGSRPWPDDIREHLLAWSRGQGKPLAS